MCVVWGCGRGAGWVQGGAEESGVVGCVRRCEGVRGCEGGG